MFGDNIKAVLFDHDDTLVGTMVPKWAHHKFVAKKFYGKELTDDEIRPHWGKPFPELVCILYETDNKEEALANNASCHEKFPKILNEGTIEILNKIHKSGKKTGIITATSRFSFEYDLKLHKFPVNSIDYTQSADDTPYHKPDPRVFNPTKKWLKQNGIKPNEVVYVADGLMDLKAAKGAGIHFVGVETGLVKKPDFKKNGVLSFKNIQELNQQVD